MNRFDRWWPDRPLGDDGSALSDFLRGSTSSLKMSRRQMLAATNQGMLALFLRGSLGLGIPVRFETRPDLVYEIRYPIVRTPDGWCLAPSRGVTRRSLPMNLVGESTVSWQGPPKPIELNAEERQLTGVGENLRIRLPGPMLLWGTAGQFWQHPSGPLAFLTEAMGLGGSAGWREQHAGYRELIRWFFDPFHVHPERPALIFGAQYKERAAFAAEKRQLKLVEEPVPVATIRTAKCMPEAEPNWCRQHPMPLSGLKFAPVGDTVRERELALWSGFDRLRHDALDSRFRSQESYVTYTREDQHETQVAKGYVPGLRSYWDSDLEMVKAANLIFAVLPRPGREDFSDVEDLYVSVTDGLAETILVANGRRPLPMFLATVPTIDDLLTTSGLYRHGENKG